MVCNHNADKHNQRGRERKRVCHIGKTEPDGSFSSSSSLLLLLLPVLKCTNFHCTRLISINSRLCVCVDSVPQFSKALIELSFFWTANLSVELLLLLPLVATSPSAVCVCCLSSFSG